MSKYYKNLKDKLKYDVKVIKNLHHIFCKTAEYKFTNMEKIKKQK